MLAVYQMIIPTPYPVGPVNVYLIKNDPITLIEVGPDTPQASKALEHMLELLGCRVEDIKRIVVTHSHPDHCGMAEQVARASGAVVHIHPLEESKIKGKEDFYKERMPFILETGIPEEVLKEVIGEKDQLPEPSLEDISIKLLSGGERISFDGGELRILHLPGHSPGHLCAYEPEQKLFFSGDFLLPHITPNPLMEPDHEKPGLRLPSLKQYLSGLEVLEKLEVNLVFPGHGGAFNDCGSAINVARQHHQEQFTRIIANLQGGERNAYQLCMAIYPGLQKFGISLGLSEIVAHLDYLVENGNINCSKQQGINYYCL
ncbi:MBL fold metallo-hydrolase [Sporotomaculum syntrophicum]|uniref:MBL fold metallo-hydrolase n=1 Tax=Sporotomaculum syntrophicum TaxID=182264 RepID=UPI00137A76E5|nr:MBL fold metallo-hydrolase [Sporotomaculum syntrophicum]